MTGNSRIPCASGEQPGTVSSVAGDRQSAKAALRNALKARRRALDASQKAEWDTRIGEQILAWCRRNPVPSVGVYWPLHGEPDLRFAYAELAQAGLRLALPVVVARDAPLAFAAWAPGEPMVTDGMGVGVPGELRFVERPAALLVPCLGFNAARYRLGYGGGYYDRTLAAEPRPVTLGVAYACQQAEFEGAEHDIALDLIITEAA